MADRTALGVLNLEGYEVVNGKTKDKKYYFDIVPKFTTLKTVHFYTETEIERER